MHIYIFGLESAWYGAWVDPLVRGWVLSVVAFCFEDLLFVRDTGAAMVYFTVYHHSYQSLRVKSNVGRKKVLVP